MSRVASPPPEMSLIAFQGDFCFAFMFSNFVWRSYGTPWLDQAAAGKLGSLSLDATKALSEANFGRSNHKRDIELNGVVQYGKCLKTLAGALGSGAVQGRQDLLVPILVLLMHALVASLYGKQRLFVEEERWRTVPYERNKGFKTPQSQLLDILVVVPGILQDHEAIQSMDEDGPNSRGELLERVERQLVALYRWRWQWQARSGNHVESDTGNTPQLNGRAAEALGSIGTSRQSGRLRLAKFELATELMLYNATLMWLIALHWKIDPISASARIEACADAAMPNEPTTKYVSFEPLRRPGGAVTVRDPALEICRVFEWVTRHHCRSKEPSFLYLFPIGVAMSVLEREPETKAWATSLLNISPITANYARGQNAAGFGFYITPEALHPEEVIAKEQLFSAQDIQQLSA
ncbi:hypothetical protein IL306_014349 [Fusarium sp. DS 682]|nr:hypothetical protein IL306_014349 [Fusarium sp. DS 682]